MIRLKISSPRLARLLTSFILVAISSFSTVSAAADYAARIVNVEGKGEKRDNTDQSWGQARINEKLAEGAFVRTGSSSRMALLMVDQTQLSLTQNSQLQIKNVAFDNGSTSTAIRLNAGRAWTQTKNVQGRMTMETPTVTASIRGTDWDMQVNEDGKSTITVLSGVVELQNEFGGLSVNAGEQAVTEQGKAPVKIFITNPRDRVQWVSLYPLDPLRHITYAQAKDAGTSPVDRADNLCDSGQWAEAGRLYREAGQQAGTALGLTFVHLRAGNLDAARAQLAQVSDTPRDHEKRVLAQTSLDILEQRYDLAKANLETFIATEKPSQVAPFLILADLHAREGDLPAAIATDRLGLEHFPQSSRLHAHLVKLNLLAGNQPEAEIHAREARKQEPDGVDALLSHAIVARFAGRSIESEAAVRRAVKVAPNDDHTWFALGSALTEKEYVIQAGEALQKALQLNPNGAGYQGELGSLDAFANRYGAATHAFSEALQNNPADYVALTGQGILLLKQGHVDAALESLLAASLVEPKYARAHLYIAIAYYQLGRTRNALAEIERAKALDPLDPLPAMVASLIHTDHYEAYAAVQEARDALQLMPNLKSLNQLANDQKGGANLGTAFFNWEMREWAASYAEQSNDNFWAGSHLLRAQVYQNGFAKNSELVNGYLLDPLVFGASNRFQSIIQKPGSYLAANLNYSRDRSITSNMPQVTANGEIIADNSTLISYYTNFSKLDDAGRNPHVVGDYQDQLHTGTLALGIVPDNRLKLFTLYEHDSYIGHWNPPAGTISGYPSTANYTFDNPQQHLQAGGSYQPDPAAQTLFRVSEDRTRLKADLITSIPDLYTNSNASDRIDENRLGLQITHTVKPDATTEFDWGAEAADRNLDDPRVMTQAGSSPIPLRDKSRSGLINFGSKFSRDRSYVQADLFYNEYSRSYFAYGPLGSNGPFVAGNTHFSAISPRLGGVWDTGNGHLFRIAYQDWLKPVSTTTLTRITTAGIALDDSQLLEGGRLHRLAGSFEGETSHDMFIQVTLDHREARNLEISFPTIRQSSQQQLLSGQTAVPNSTQNLNQLLQQNVADQYAGTPDNFTINMQSFARSRVDQAKLAINGLLGATTSYSLGYLLSDSVVNDPVTGRVPHVLPRSQISAGTTWISPLHLKLSLRAIHMSSIWDSSMRPQTMLNLDAGWESADKRGSTSFFVRHAGANDLNALYGIMLGLKL